LFAGALEACLGAAAGRAWATLSQTALPLLTREHRCPRPRTTPSTNPFTRPFPPPPRSEDEADRAHRRLQALRAFRFAAAQFVASLQAFLHARTSGEGGAPLAVEACLGLGLHQDMGGGWATCTSAQQLLGLGGRQRGAVAARWGPGTPRTHTLTACAAPLLAATLARRLLGAPAGQADGQLRGGGGRRGQPPAQR
jgi:hypothetical protein